MKNHDPYGPMLSELRSVNDSDDDDIFYGSLRQLQQYVEQLRQAYKNSPSNVDFSCRYTRAAYLLAYYPYYIEPIYWILSQLKGHGIEEFLNQNKLRICFIGAGPAPEALGLIAFLNENCPDTKCVIGYLMDKFVDGWRLGQEITRYHLAPKYWPRGKLFLKPIEFDFLKEVSLSDPFSERAIQNSYLFVMQNCLNDQLDNPKAAREMVMRIFRQAPSGALFIISDLKFRSVRDLICTIEKAIVEESLGKVILPVKNECATIQSSIEVPQIVKDHLLINSGLLIPKKYTHFYSSILLREQSDDEIPF